MTEDFKKSLEHFTLESSAISSQMLKMRDTFLKKIMYGVLGREATKEDFGRFGFVKLEGAPIDIEYFQMDSIVIGKIEFFVRQDGWNNWKAGYMFTPGDFGITI